MSGFSKQKDVSKGKRTEFAPLKYGDFFCLYFYMDDVVATKDLEVALKLLYMLRSQRTTMSPSVRAFGQVYHWLKMDER